MTTFPGTSCVDKVRTTSYFVRSCNIESICQGDIETGGPTHLRPTYTQPQEMRTDLENISEMNKTKTQPAVLVPGMRPSVPVSFAAGPVLQCRSVRVLSQAHQPEAGQSGRALGCWSNGVTQFRPFWSTRFRTPFDPFFFLSFLFWHLAVTPKRKDGKDREKKTKRIRSTLDRRTKSRSIQRIFAAVRLPPLTRLQCL